MSDGLRRVAGAGSPITLAGRTFRTSPLTLGMRAEIEAHLVARRANLLVKVAEQLDAVPARHHDALWDAAMRQTQRQAVAGDAEVAEYLHTFEGACFLLWLLVRGEHPEIDCLDKAIELARPVPLWELQAGLDRASGTADLKNSAGPANAGPLPAAPRGTEPVAKAQEGTSPFPGLASTATSLGSITGSPSA